MKLLKLAICSLALIAFVGCAGPYSGGILFSDYNALLCAPDDAQGLTPGPKVGEATMTNFLGFVAIGDASITTAAQNGNIKKIQTVDYKYNSILGIVNKTTTIVTGQ
jgi:hypothetical protein